MIRIGGLKKLVTILRKIERYPIQDRNLKLYQKVGLKVGLKVARLWTAIEFNQSAWLQQFINFNTGKRTKAKNFFEKDFFKLTNYSIPGKTMEKNLEKS